MATDYLSDNQAYLVDVSVSLGNRIVITIDHEQGIGIQTCAALSRWIEKHLDRETEDFSLDVTSPGLDQPFKVFRQYVKNVGKEIDVKRVDGTRVAGILISADEQKGIVLEQRGREKVEGKKSKQLVVRQHELTMDQIKETKIVIKF